MTNSVRAATLRAVPIPWVMLLAISSPRLWALLVEVKLGCKRQCCRIYQLREKIKFIFIFYYSAVVN